MLSSSTQSGGNGLVYTTSGLARMITSNAIPSVFSNFLRRELTDSLYFKRIKNSAAYVSPSFTNRRMRVSYFSSRAIEHCGAAQRRPCISI